MTAAAPKLAYWHLWADDDGVSRQTRCDLSQFESASLGPGDSPQWNDRVLKAGNAFLTVLPVGWTTVPAVYENPKKTGPTSAAGPVHAERPCELLRAGHRHGRR